MLAMLHAWWTAALLIVFVAIVAWAYSARRKEEFDAAARIVLEDEREQGSESGNRSDGDG